MSFTRAPWKRLRLWFFVHFITKCNGFTGKCTSVCKSFWSLLTVLSTQGPGQCIQVRDLVFVLPLAHLNSNPRWCSCWWLLWPSRFQMSSFWSSNIWTDGQLVNNGLWYKLWTWLSRYCEFFLSLLSYAIQVCTCLASICLTQYNSIEARASQHKWTRGERSEKVNQRSITSTHVTWPVIDLYWWSRITIYM